jgi:hypothetical protein
LLTREAAAQGPTIAYAAPKACPSAEEFTARVAETLQRPLAGFEPLGRFRVTIARAPGGYELSVRSELDGEQGTRTLSGPDCNALADAGALSIALSLSSAMERRGQARRAAETQAEAKPSASEPRVAPPFVASNSPRRAEPQHTSLGLQLLGDYGSLPRLAPGVRVSFGGEGRRWSGRLGVLALLPATRWVDGQTGQVGGRFWLGAGRVDSCVRVAGDRRGVALHGCLVFEAGALTGSGVGVDVAKRDTLVWLAPGGRIVAAAPLDSRARGLLGLEAVVPISSHRFTVENGRTEVYRPKHLVGRVDLGVAWQFW